LREDDVSEVLDVMAVLFLALRGEDRRTVGSTTVGVVETGDGGDEPRSEDAGGVAETGEEGGPAGSEDGGVPGSGIVESVWVDISTSPFEVKRSSISMTGKSKRGVAGEELGSRR
jgi:hypothetical protein